MQLVCLMDIRSLKYPQFCSFSQFIKPPALNWWNIKTQMSDFKWVIRCRFGQRAAGADDPQESLLYPIHWGEDRLKQESFQFPSRVWGGQSGNLFQKHALGVLIQQEDAAAMHQECSPKAAAKATTPQHHPKALGCLHRFGLSRILSAALQQVHQTPSNAISYTLLWRDENIWGINTESVTLAQTSPRALQVSKSFSHLPYVKYNHILLALKWRLKVVYETSPPPPSLWISAST